MQSSVRLLIAAIFVLLTASLVRAEDVQGEIAAAKQTCNQNASVCVEKLAQIADKLVTAYREHGDRNDETLGAIWTELKKHPLPPDSDSKKLAKLLVGKWDSPRRTYVFKANGKYGSEDGSINRIWKIEGNQLIEDDSRSTILLLNSKYFIYFEGDDVFFHSRSK
jgi:hypothetical protein